MKTDKLEQFIRDNRNEFDDKIPDPALFNKIGKPGPEVIRLNWTKILVRAAAVMVLFVSSYIFIDYLVKQGKTGQVEVAVGDDENDNSMVRELVEADYYYTSQINEKREEFYCLTVNNTGLRDDINTELIELDQVFKSLKDDLKDNADNEEVVVAMIQNYRLKLKILDEILSQLRSADKKNECNENENVSI